MSDSVLPSQRQVWGRRQSRPLKVYQRQALENLWPRISLELPGEGKFDPYILFPPACQDICLEIGFGGGEHLAAQAALHPHTGFIGCEPFINGVASLAVHIQDRSLTNIKIFRDDARLLLARLPDQSLSRIFILFPDPWPKKRHHKRRMVQDASLETFARVLRPDGLLLMATDHHEYGDWMQAVMQRHPVFKFCREGRDNIRQRPQDWPQTRYEQKALSLGNAPVYLIYRKQVP